MVRHIVQRLTLISVLFFVAVVLAITWSGLVNVNHFGVPFTTEPVCLECGSCLVTLNERVGRCEFCRIGYSLTPARQ